MNTTGIKRALALCLTAAVAVLAAVTPVSAAKLYEEVSGETAWFDQYLIVDEYAGVPAVTFSYEIKAGEAVPEAEDGLEVLAGVGTPAVGTAAFSPADDLRTAVAEGDNVTLESGERYAKHTVAIDFSGCAYGEPGIYR